MKIEEEKKEKLKGDLKKEFLRMIPYVGPLLITSSTAAEYIKASNMASATSIELFTDTLTVSDVEKISEVVQTDQNPEIKLKEEIVNLLNKKIQSIKMNIEKPIQLQSGNSAVQIFTIRSKRSILFTPSVYALHLQIEYEVDGVINHDVIDHSFFIGASLSSMIIGSIIGGTMGHVVKDIFNNGLILNFINSFNFTSAIPYILILIANISLAIITVIVFSRKKDVQPIFAIEDFWGGILLGFIVGYTGKSFIEQIFPSFVQ